MTVADREELADVEHVTQLHAVLERLDTTHEYVSGLFAAVVSGPDVVPPSDWLPEVLGDYALASKAEAQEVVGLVMTLYQDVVTVLKESPEALAPEAADIDGIEEFCAGYLTGSRMHRQWADDEIGSLFLLPMTVLSGEFPIDEIEGPDDKPLPDPEAWLQGHREKLGQYVSDVDLYWESKRQVVRTGAKVGRNDPCPCGSGKKHKKCCLQ